VSAPAQLALPLRARRAPPPWRQVREIIAPPAHRRDGPPASIDAAHRKAADQPSECEQLEAYLRGQPAGKAAWEAAADLGWDFVETDRRLSDLWRPGLTFRLKERRAGDGHGPCHVHVHVRFRANYRAEEIYVPPQRRAA